MTPQGPDDVTTFLDDLGRMLAPADPVLRAEVLAGVREHVESALGPRPWAPGDVTRVLLELGPPEEVAAALLEERGGARPARMPLLARSWLPALAVLLVALGLLVALPVVAPLALAVGASGVSASMSVLAVFVVVVLPCWLAGAVVVTAAPLWSRSEKVAVWALLPGAAALLALTGRTASLADSCAGAVGSCRGPVAGVAAAATVPAFVLVVAVTVVVLVRVARAGGRRARAADRAGLSTTAEVAALVEEEPVAAYRQWWLPVVVGVGLGAALMTVAAFPALGRARTFEGSIDSAEGYLLWSGTRERLLTAAAWAVPPWLAATALLVRSPLWRRGATLLGALVAPAALAAGLTLLGPRVMTPAHVDLLVPASGVLAVIGAAALAVVWGAGARAVPVATAARPGAAPRGPASSPAGVR